MSSATLDAITRQIDEASDDLQHYRPHEVDWRSRSQIAASLLIPWLESHGAALKTYVEEVLNAPLQLRRMWSSIRSHVNLPKEQIEAFDRQLSLDDVLRESVTGEVVSKVITKFLLDHNPELRTNGRSDYPDIFISTLDYTVLPAFRRRRSTEDEEYGAALKGSEQRPVRIPDGLEIKTCRDQIRVDCHHPHAGLHLALVFGETNRFFTVTDLRVAFLRSIDYREAARNTTATTVKYSFNGGRFVSLLLP